MILTTRHTYELEINSKIAKPLLGDLLNNCQYADNKYILSNVKYKDTSIYDQGVCLTFVKGSNFGTNYLHILIRFIELGDVKIIELWILRLPNTHTHRSKTVNEIVKLENNILYSINYDGENFTAYYVSVTFNSKYGRLEVFIYHYFLVLTLKKFN